MADKKISALTSRTKAGRGDLIPVARGGDNYGITAEALVALAQAVPAVSVSFAVQDAPSGSTFAASSLVASGWENDTELKTYTSASWGAGTTNRYLNSSSYTVTQHPFLLTSESAMDQEVTTWARVGVVYFRWTGADAIAFSLNSETQTIYLQYAANIGTNSVSFANADSFNFLAAATALGYNANDTEGDLWTFGVRGGDGYIKYNGTLIHTFKDWALLRPEPGKVGFSSNASGPYGFRDISVEMYDDCPASEKLRERVIDVGLLGFKDFVTTGSIAAASNQLITTNDPGFEVGDTVIVEIGSEAGAGLPGTVGVGGVWPALSYADQATMEADVSQAANTIAYLQDTGWVWQWNGAVWGKRAVTSVYTNRARPLSLASAVTAIADGPAGPELVVNGDFTTPDLTNWAASSGGSFVISSARLAVTAGASNTGAVYSVANTEQALYDVVLDVDLGTATSMKIEAGTLSATVLTVYASGTHRVVLEGTGTGLKTVKVLVSPAAATCYIDNFSVKRRAVGKTLTLADTATATATDATVYARMDAARLAKLLGTTATSGGYNLTTFLPKNMTVRFPATRLAIDGDTFNVNSVSREGWVVEGQGMGNTVFFSPMGVSSARIQNYCSGITFRNFTLHGNARRVGFGIDHTAQTSYPSGSAYPGGVTNSTVSNVLVTDVEVIDAWQSHVGFSYCTDCTAQRIKAVLTDGLDQYIQWLLQIADSTNCWFIDSSVDSPTMTGGFEVFRCTGSGFRRLKVRNAGGASNSSGYFLFEDIDFVLERECVPHGWSINNPLININSNMQPPHPDMSFGGTLRNIRAVMHYPLDEFAYNPICIVINASNSNVTVEGTYDGVQTFHPDLFAAPDAGVGYNSSGDYGSVGINSTGANTTVRNIRVRGKSSKEVNGWDLANISVTGAGSSVVDCVADLITLNSGATGSGNRTNAVYDRGP